MSDALTITEVKQNELGIGGIQITTELKTSLLTVRGKSASAQLGDFTKEEQGKIKEVFGFVTNKLAKKADAGYTSDTASLIAEVEKRIAEKEAVKDDVVNG